MYTQVLCVQPGSVVAGRIPRAQWGRQYYCWPPWFALVRVALQASHSNYAQHMTSDSFFLRLFFASTASSRNIFPPTFLEDACIIPYVTLRELIRQHPRSCHEVATACVQAVSFFYNTMRDENFRSGDLASFENVVTVHPKACCHATAEFVHPGFKVGACLHQTLRLHGSWAS